MVGVSFREQHDRYTKTVACPESSSDGMFGVIPKSPDHVVAFHAGESVTADATLQAVDTRGAVCPNARNTNTTVLRGRRRAWPTSGLRPGGPISRRCSPAAKHGKRWKRPSSTSRR